MSAAQKATERMLQAFETQAIDEWGNRIEEPAVATQTTPVRSAWEQQLDRARADVRNILGRERTFERSPLFAIDAAALLRTDFPPRPWQVEQLITKGGTAVVAGEPKGGIKTWILIEGALAVATGTPMCGHFGVERGAVAIFFAEDQAHAVRNRLRALLAGSHRTIDGAQLFLQPRGEFIDVLDDQDLAWVIASCRNLGRIDLLVLDPLRDIHSGEEDKSDSMRDVMRRLRVLGELLACTVWVSHHTPKVTKDNARRRPGQNLRGSSAIHGSIDSGLYIEPQEGDGTNRFGARVTSQVKSGRSAGVFDIGLSITDDDHGEAVRAEWEYSRPEFRKGSDRTQVDDDSVFAFVRELAVDGITLTRTRLREHDSRPIPEKRTTAALDRLLEQRRLLLSKGLVLIPGQEGSAND